MTEFISPLSIYFVWFPSDSDKVQPVFDYCFSLLSRDINKPFSRSMNLPIYCRTSAHESVPKEIDGLAQKNLVFIFIRACTQTYLSHKRIESSVKKAMNMFAVFS